VEFSLCAIVQFAESRMQIYEDSAGFGAQKGSIGTATLIRVDIKIEISIGTKSRLRVKAGDSPTLPQ